MNALDATSTRPYLIRALYEWCTDNGFTPYVAVAVDDSVQVPREYVKNNEIVLNISFDATSSLQLGNEFIEFKARFAGSAREIMVPISHVLAIYARENGQGMAFPVNLPANGASAADSPKAGPSTTSVAPAPKPDGAASASDGKSLQLVPERADGGAGDKGGATDGKGHGEGEAGTDDGPQPPASPPRTRPSLKRVK